ncbi:MAG: 50S ribosomal protein L21 [Acidobacteriota bacterium]
MFAVVNIGGKQRRVEKGDRLRVELIDANVGDKVALSPVFLLQSGNSVKVGTPHVEGASVSAKVVAQGRHPRILVFKKKRRKQYKRKNGHRQSYTEVEIQSIVAEKAKD